jgi:hypothetical protein
MRPRKVSPVRYVAGGKCGWLGASGSPCGSRPEAVVAQDHVVQVAVPIGHQQLQQAGAVRADGSPQSAAVEPEQARTGGILEAGGVE